MIRTLSGIDLLNKKVFLRLDLNVPIKNGFIQDESRIKAALPTLQYLKNAGAITFVASHLGRPNGVFQENLSTSLLQSSIEDMLQSPITCLNQCFGAEVVSAAEKAKPGDVFLLENLRFHPEETSNDKTMSKNLAKGMDIYVNDAFGAAHRAHASTEGISNFLPSYAGFLMEKEIKILSELMESPPKPLCVIMGGAKMETKLSLLQGFCKKADDLIIGGALANTFLAAQGYNVGDSLYEADKINLAKDIMSQSKTLHLPKDVVVSGEISTSMQTKIKKISEVTDGEKILDIGPETYEFFTSILKKAGTIVWNGPLGLYEHEEFSAGTRAIAQAISESNALRVLGGGDTLDAIHHFGFKDEDFTHVSTGGGAMLAYLEGKSLPALKALLQTD